MKLTRIDIKVTLWIIWIELLAYGLWQQRWMFTVMKVAALRVLSPND